MQPPHGESPTLAPERVRKARRLAPCDPHARDPWSARSCARIKGGCPARRRGWTDSAHGTRHGTRHARHTCRQVSEIARASSRRAHAPARPVPRPGPAYCSVLPSADGGCAFGSRSKPRYVTTLLRQVATAFCAIPCIRHGAPLLLGAPPPPRPSFHEDLAMGPYEGSGLHRDDCISCKAAITFFAHQPRLN